MPREDGIPSGIARSGDLRGAFDAPCETIPARLPFDLIQQRSAPRQLVTSSVVKAESANYIVNAKLLVPVQKGDMLLWSQFETRPDTSQAPAPVSDAQVK